LSTTISPIAATAHAFRFGRWYAASSNATPNVDLSPETAANRIARSNARFEFVIAKGPFAS
jgi:hypothetical protein